VLMEHADRLREEVLYAKKPKPPTNHKVSPQLSGTEMRAGLGGYVQGYVFAIVPRDHVWFFRCFGRCNFLYRLPKRRI